MPLYNVTVTVTADHALGELLDRERVVQVQAKGSAEAIILGRRHVALRLGEHYSPARHKATSAVEVPGSARFRFRDKRTGIVVVGADLNAAAIEAANAAEDMATGLRYSSDEHGFTEELATFERILATDFVFLPRHELVVRYQGTIANRDEVVAVKRIVDTINERGDGSTWRSHRLTLALQADGGGILADDDVAVRLTPASSAAW